MVDPKYLDSTNFSIHLLICLALILKHLSYPQQFHSSSRQSIPPCLFQLLPIPACLTWPYLINILHHLHVILCYFWFPYAPYRMLFLDLQRYADITVVLFLSRKPHWCSLIITCLYNLASAALSHSFMVWLLSFSTPYFLQFCTSHLFLKGCISTCLLHSWDILSLSNVVLASLRISTGISGLTAFSFITLFIAAPTSTTPLLILWTSWFSICPPSAFLFLSFSHCFLCKMYVKSESTDANYLTSIGN